MKKFLFVLANVAAVSTVPQVAHATFLNTSLSYGQISDDGVDVDIVSGNYNYERAFGIYSLSGGVSATKLSSGSDEIRTIKYSATVGVDINPALTAFAGFNSFDIDSPSPFIEEDPIYSYTLGMEHKVEDVTYGAALTRFDQDGEKVDAQQLYVDYSTFTTGAYASVLFAEDEEYFAFGVSRDVAAYDASFDAVIADGLNIYMAEFSYNIQTRTRLNAGFELWDADGDQIRRADIGAGYMVAENIWLDAAYQNYDMDGDGADGFTLKVSYDLGTSRLRAVDRINTISVLDPIGVFAN